MAQSVEGSPYVSRRLSGVEECQLSPLPGSPSASPYFGNSKRWRSCREVEEICSPPPGYQTSTGNNSDSDEQKVYSQSDAADFSELDVHAFTFEEIVVATKDFSSRVEATGTVYTGILSDGCEVAVKSFLTSEVLLNKLQQDIFIFTCLDHLNIARLLGYCKEKNEFMLIYEFMHNRSLSNFLNQEGETRFKLGWEITYKICLGIAKGLAYLHNDSGMEVIHGDINPTNIFLDADLNPKITNFPFSHCLSNDHIYSDTNAEELFKTLVEKDVYNYGLVILALVSGKHCFREANETLHYMYQLHETMNKQGNLLQFVDPRFGLAYSEEEAAQLLDLCCSCTKDDSMLRPSVSEVLSSLEGKRGFEELNILESQDDVITEIGEIDRIVPNKENVMNLSPTPEICSHESELEVSHISPSVLQSKVNRDGGDDSVAPFSDPSTSATKAVGNDSLKLTSDISGDNPLDDTNDIDENFSVIDAIQITDEPDGLGEAPSSSSFPTAKVPEDFDELKTLVLGSTLKEALDDDNKSKILRLCEILDGSVLSEVQASLVHLAKHFLTFSSEFYPVRKEDSLYLGEYESAKLKAEEIKGKAKNLHHEATSIRVLKKSIKNDINHIMSKKTKMQEKLIKLDEELSVLLMRQADEENKLAKIQKDVASDAREIKQLANWLTTESGKKNTIDKRIKQAQERLDEGQEYWKHIQVKFQ